MKNKSEKICILGAGISGLTAAYYLANKGYKNVTVLEKEPRVGGKCYSFLYKGKTYELGSMMGVPSYYNINSIMKELKITNKGPLIYGDFFDINGKKTYQIPLNEIKDFKKQYKILINILNRYDKLYEPGLTNISDDLCLPFSKWCEINNISLVSKVYEPPFTAFGYGYINEVPAAYVLKFLDYKTLSAFIDITHLTTFPEGIDVLCKKMADMVPNLKLGIQVKNIKRNNSVIIVTQYETLTFDKIIITTPLDETEGFLDLTQQEKNLFSKIIYSYYNVFAYSLKNIPNVSGYIPYNFNADRIRHAMVWYYRWQDIPNNDLVTIYSLCKKNDSSEKCKNVIEEDLKNLGIEIDNLLVHKRWKHFPHVTGEDLKKGFYNELNKLQMENNTLYAGELLDFSNIEHCAQYSKYIVDKYF